jgi:hypothetical protein
MRQQYKNSYQFAKPPKALLKSRLDHIAIVPASMLPFTKTLKEKVKKLPQGAVFLCYAEENTRQRKLLQHVEETFRQQGRAVRSMSMEEVFSLAEFQGAVEHMLASGTMAGALTRGGGQRQPGQDI